MRRELSIRFACAVCMSVLAGLALVPSSAGANDLEEQGFAGTWRGEYVCKGVETGVDLTFKNDQISGESGFTWTFYPLTSGASFQSGAFSGQVVPGEQPNSASMVPKAWIERPGGFVMVAADLAIEADGEMTGTIDLDGCGEFRAQLIAPAEEVGDTPDTAFLNTLTGRWWGWFSCGDTRFAAELNLPQFVSEDVEGSFLYKKRDGVDTVTNQIIGFLFAATNEEVGLKVLKLVSYKVNQQTYVPLALRTDADPDALTIKLDEPTCSPVTLRRDDLTGPIAILPVPLSPTQTTVFAPDIRDDRRLHFAPTQAVCEALSGWRAQITDADAQLGRAGRRILKWGAWPTLFTDSKFVPFFGVPYSVVAGKPEVAKLLGHRLIRQDCRQLGVRIDLETVVLHAAFGVKDTRFGTNFHALQLAILDVKQDSGLLQQLLAEIANVSTDAAGVSALSGIEAQIQALTNLSEADAITAAARLADRRAEIKVAMDDAFLDAIASNQVSFALADALRAEEIATIRGGADRDRVTLLLEDRLVAVVEAELISPARDLGGAELATFTDRQQERFKPLRRYTVVSDSFAMLQQRIAAEAEDQVAVLKETIDRTQKIANLRATYRALSEFAQDPRATQLSRELWSLYDAKAFSLLQAAISELPPRRTRQSTRPTSSGALAGLHRNAEITAFLSGDKLAAYQAPRQSTLIYVAELSSVFRAYCPAALPPGISTLIAGKFINLDALTGDRDAMAAAGWQAIAEGLQVLANPGPAMQEAIRRDEIRNSATADAQILLSTFPCTGPDLRVMFTNIADWVKNPATEIAQAEKNLFDICLQAVGNGLVMRETREYCRCASDRIPRTATKGFDRYLSASPKSHWRQISYLDRRLHQSLRTCRR